MIRIEGGRELKGKVWIQGSKNAAMKYAVLPLLAASKFTFENIPAITSVTKLLKISQSQGAKVEWIGKNSFSIDTRTVTGAKEIKAKDFYFTSGGVLFIPILVSRFGKAVVEKHKLRNDYGGDMIGSRTVKMVKETLKQFGIESKESGGKITFFLKSKKAFNTTIPRKSVTVTMFAIITAIFKEGQSIIREIPLEAQIKDVIKFLQKAGADIKVKNRTIYINGGVRIRGVRHKSISDYNDLATWVLMAVGTGSKLELNNTDLKTMGMKPLLKLLDKWKVKRECKNEKFIIDAREAKLVPINIKAGQLPMFHTDWQPLLTPILTKIEGKSNVVDTFFDNRMGHCEELGKMGMNYKLFEKNHGVKIIGGIKLHGAEVEAKDVRGGAALIIASLMTKGETKIEGVEHIKRGYENMIERLQKIGAKAVQ